MYTSFEYFRIWFNVEIIMSPSCLKFYIKGTQIEGLCPPSFSYVSPPNLRPIQGNLIGYQPRGRGAKGTRWPAATLHHLQVNRPNVNQLECHTLVPKVIYAHFQRNGVTFCIRQLPYNKSFYYLSKIIVGPKYLWVHGTNNSQNQLKGRSK